MGTRHLICAFSGGEYKIAQYGQWDGYPEGQGVTALTFLRSKANRELLKSQLSKCYFITQEQYTNAWKEAGVNLDENGGWATLEQGKKFRSIFPMMDRDHGAKILELVSESKEKAIPLQNSIDFANDGIFCEFVYVVDFDHNTFEIYKGFGTKPVPDGERFAAGNNNPQTGAASKEKYYPAKLVKTYPLDKLPTKKIFLSDLKEL